MLIAFLWVLACDGEGGGGSDDTSGADDSATNPKINHEACDAYLECLQIVAPAEVGPALEAYGTEGACWDSKENATLCNDACTTLMEKLAKAFPDVAECGGTGGGSEYPTALDVEWHSNSVTVTVTGGSGDLDFGISEGQGPKRWTAEDCFDETTGYGPYCHEVGADDATDIPCVGSVDDVDDGHTLFCVVSDASLGYYLATQDGSWCAVLGSQIHAWDGLDCENWN